jgi:hypothetical protein
MLALRVHVTTPLAPAQPGEVGLTGNVVGDPLTAVPLTETTVSEICAVAGDTKAARRLAAAVLTGEYCCTERVIAAFAVP